MYWRKLYVFYLLWQSLHKESLKYRLIKEKCWKRYAAQPGQALLKVLIPQDLIERSNAYVVEPF